MKAIRVHDFGGPEVLKLEEVTKPIPGKGEVVVAVKAIGINPFDQPDVQAAKDKTKEVLAGGDVELRPEGELQEHEEGDYYAVQAFIDG